MNNKKESKALPNETIRVYNEFQIKQGCLILKQG